MSNPFEAAIDALSREIVDDPERTENYHAAIRVLIESSGDKACGAVEEAMVPAIELLENHYLQESLAYGNSIHAKSYKAAIAVIKSALQPKRVTQEWVDKWAQKIDRLYVGNRNAVLFMLEELDLEVEP